MSDKRRVLIISTSRALQNGLEHEISRRMDDSLIVSSTGSFGQDAAWWQFNRPSALVVHFPSDESLQSFFISKLSLDVPNDMAVVVVSELITPQVLKLSLAFRRLRVLKAPSSGEQLYRSVLEAMSEYNDLEQQRHPRFQTDQEVLVVSDFKPGQLKANLRNLSLSGAFIEAPTNGMSLEKDDIIRVEISMAKEKRYQFDAKVVWVRGRTGGDFGFGVRFIDKDEVYNTLLKGVV